MIYLNKSVTNVMALIKISPQGLVMKQLATLFAIGFLSLNSTSALSDLIEIELTGIINSASWDFSVYGFGGLPYTVGMNDVMTQTYVYDDNAQTLVSANTAINGQVFGIESLTSGTVTLSDNSIVGDQVHAELNGTSTGYTALSQAYVSMTIDLFDSTGTAFTGTSLTGFDRLRPGSSRLRHRFPRPECRRRSLWCISLRDQRRNLRRTDYQPECRTGPCRRLAVRLRPAGSLGPGQAKELTPSLY